MDAKKIREVAAELVTLASECEAKEQPPKPSQAWLDKHGVELTGECRPSKVGELRHWIKGAPPERRNDPAEDFGPSECLYDDPPDVMRWILRKRAAATPPAGLLKGDWEHTGELREPRYLGNGRWESYMGCDGAVWDDKPTIIAGCTPCESIGYTDSRRWIVRPKAKQPVPTAADIPEGWKIDQGPMRWEDAAAITAPARIYYKPSLGGWNDVMGRNVIASVGPDDITYTLKPVAKPAPKVTPWELSPLHARKVVIRNDGAGWGMIAGVRDGQFIIPGWGKVSPAELLRDWKWDVTGSPCGEVAK